MVRYVPDAILLTHSFLNTPLFIHTGVIDILQYYNARKMGETVIRKAAGNSGQDISCVDPETYGKRFVKFLSNLVEE